MVSQQTDNQRYQKLINNHPFSLTKKFVNIPCFFLAQLKKKQ